MSKSIGKDANVPRESDVLGTAMFAFHRRSSTMTKPIRLHQVPNELLIAMELLTLQIRMGFLQIFVLSSVLNDTFHVIICRKDVGAFSHEILDDFETFFIRWP